MMPAVGNLSFLLHETAYFLKCPFSRECKISGTGGYEKEIKFFDSSYEAIFHATRSILKAQEHHFSKELSMTLKEIQGKNMPWGEALRAELAYVWGIGESVESIRNYLRNLNMCIQSDPFFSCSAIPTMPSFATQQLDHGATAECGKSFYIIMRKCDYTLK
jgi:hypothetical protein